jgi:hypothetical protein
MMSDDPIVSEHGWTLELSFPVGDRDYWVLSREGLSSRDVGQFRLKFRGMNYVEGTDYRFVPTKK